MDTPVLRGRSIGRADTASSPPVVVVNQAFVRRHFGDRDPIGQAIAIADGSGDRHMQIIGVVADAKYRSLHERPEPTVFGALDQEPRLPPSSLRVVVRSTGAAPGATRTVLEAIAGVHRDIAVSLQPFQQDVDGATTQDRLLATLAAMFGAVALLLAAIGLFGVLSHAVVRRTSEIGVRMALGAEPGRVRRQVLGQVAVVTIAGLALGALVAAAASRALGSLLFGLTPSDAGVAVTSTCLLAAVAVASSYLPARRASRIAPAVALRE
jgi:ABC-type antimicrobial peptide transport system permease subunit